MASRAKDFKAKDVRRALLWCARHCCLCGKQCGIGIELAHIDRNGSNDLENGIPVCFDCHLAIGGYDIAHPRGRKLSFDELKTRRNQVYEKHTSHLLPTVAYEVTQEVRRRGEVVKKRILPDVGFFIEHRGGPFPVKVRVGVTLAQGGRTLGPPSTHGHYDNTFVWNLNPGFGVNGHFNLPQSAMRNLSSGQSSIRARVDVTLIDVYEREHRLLPIGYVLPSGRSDSWYLEPSEDALAISLPSGVLRRGQQTQQRKPRQ